MSKLRPAMGARQNVGPGRRLQPFFTAVCIYTRQNTRASRAHVADLAGVKEVSIDRFEEGKTFPKENFERYAAAYAYDTGIDPRELIGLALTWWEQHGGPPLTSHQERELVEREPSAMDVLGAIRRTETDLEPGEASQRPTATRRRRVSAG